jgi:hypothetical protein
LKPVLAEQWAWDDRDDTAGQWDLLVECPDRGLGLLDWKTSNYLLPQHHVQVAKYKRLIEKWRPNWHIGWVELWKVPKTLERIEIEVRSLGDCYNFKKRKQVTYSEEQLEMLWLSALAQYRVFKG